MSITPLEKQQVSGSAVAVYEGLEKRGKVINFFKVLAYKPEILKTFLDFYQEVWREGKLPAVTKELAYCARRFSMDAPIERAHIPHRRGGRASAKSRSQH